MASPGDFHDFLKIKFKVREDRFSDHYNRIFMMKIMLVFAAITGINWFKDEISCIIPSSADIDKDFVNAACWIQGLYVYKAVNGTGRTAYHGIPMEIHHDGFVVAPDKALCSTANRDRLVRGNCKALAKTFYLQYQWFPFYLALLGALFYFPYIVFKVVNTDLASLRRASDTESASRIIASFFNRGMNSMPRMKIRVLLNLLVKILYIFSNIASFLLTDALINGDFRTYGQRWSGWSSSRNEAAYQYSANRAEPKAGEFLLPAFGLCEVMEAAVDALMVKQNVHTFVCEISMHILYQYVLIVMWVLLVLGMTISALGFIVELVEFTMSVMFHTSTSVLFLKQGSCAREVYRRMGVREVNYLELLRRINLKLYKDVLDLLIADRADSHRRSSNPANIMMDTVASGSDAGSKR